MTMVTKDCHKREQTLLQCHAVVELLVIIHLKNVAFLSRPPPLYEKLRREAKLSEQVLM